MIREFIAQVRTIFTASAPSLKTIERVSVSIPTKTEPSRKKKREVETIKHGPGSYQISVPAGIDPTSAFERAQFDAAMSILNESKAQARADEDLLSELDDEPPPADDPALTFEQNRLGRREWHLARVAASRTEYFDLCANEGITPREDWIPKRDRALAKRRERESRATYHAGSPSVFDRIFRRAF